MKILWEDKQEMIQMILKQIKLYNFYNIRETRWINIDKLTLIVGKQIERKESLFDLLLITEYLFKSSDLDIIHFTDAINFKECEIILEYKINGRLKNKIYDIVKEHNIDIRKDIKICKTKNNKFFIDLFTNIPDDKHLNYKKIVDLLKKSMPIFKKIEIDEDEDNDILYKKSNVVFLCDNMEEFCLRKAVDIKSYYKHNFNNNMLIVFTTPPFVDYERNCETVVFEIDKGFNEKKLSKISNQFDIPIWLMLVGMILFFIGAVFRFYYLYPQNKDADLIVVILDTFSKLSKEIGVISDSCFVLSFALSLIVKSMKVKDYLTAIFISPVLSSITVIVGVFPLGIMILNLGLTIILTYYIFYFAYQTISNSLLWLLSLVLDVIAKHFEEIDVGIGNNIKNLIYIYIYVCFYFRKFNPLYIFDSKIYYKGYFWIG